MCSEVDETEFPMSHDHIGDDFPDPLPPVPDLAEFSDNDIEDGKTRLIYFFNIKCYNRYI